MNAPAPVGPRILLVIPTLGRRPEYLRQTLESIRNQSPPADIVVVCPVGAVQARQLATEFGASVLDDPGSLSGAVNVGIGSHGPEHIYANWLGDDDLLTPGSLALTAGALDRDPSAVLAFGWCRYIDAEGRALWISRAGRLAPWLMTWGPDLVPQPGMLFRVAAYETLCGLDETLNFAMDLDLLLRLKRVGRIANVGTVVSAFRWHHESLTVSDRSRSLAESNAVKLRYLGKFGRRGALIWRPIVDQATRMAAKRVTKLAVKAASSHGQ